MFFLKVNYGLLLLEALFRRCPFVNIQQSGVIPSSDDNARKIHIPNHMPIVFSEVAGRTLYRVEYKDSGHEYEQQALTNIIPLWIIDPIVNVN